MLKIFLNTESINMLAEEQLDYRYGFSITEHRLNLRINCFMKSHKSINKKGKYTWHKYYFIDE